MKKKSKWVQIGEFRITSKKDFLVGTIEIDGVKHKIFGAVVTESKKKFVNEPDIKILKVEEE